MRSFCLPAAALLFCALFCYRPVLAGEEASHTPAPNAPLPAISKPEIITDEKAGSVRVLIAGKEILRIDARGLHVTGDIEYTGANISVDAKTPPATPSKTP